MRARRAQAFVVCSATMKMLTMVTLVASLALVACGGSGAGHKDSATPASGAASAAAAEEPLFVRLGGLDGITAVVDAFLENVKVDDRINARFANVDMNHLRQMAIDQLCDATGGGPIVGCKYTGKNMVEAHTGMKITDAEFDAAVEDLGRALDTVKVPEKTRHDLLGGLAGMKRDIVDH
jgi:hemoglobin